MPPTDPEIAATAAAERVVVFRSGLTDVSRIEAALGTAGVAYRVEDMPMASQAMRERFRRLKDETGWPTLPMIFVDGEFVGGETELLRHAVLGNGGPATGPSATARWLGLGGLLPFFLPVAAIAAGDNDGWFLRWLVAYGAVILSFVGALQWGLALDSRTSRRAERFIVSVIPGLGAWLALLMPTRAGLALLLAGFLGIYAYERATLRDGGYPPWFRSLRTLLTAGACLALALGMALARPL